MWYDKLAKQPWDTQSNFWMPRAVNAAADGSDTMFYAVLGMSFFFFFAIAADAQKTWHHLGGGHFFNQLN